MTRSILTLGVLGVLCGSVLLFGQEQATGKYYKKWLNEDVVWIITEEEASVFSKLTTDEERDAFIEQFWLRRDPDPSTRENDFKEEHYRRIVYANENFSAGIAGWKSDRGMIYIKFGPPDRRETYPAGGQYTRQRKEGGGVTSIFPMERWEYRRLEGLGEDVELEFVDDKGGGLFELTFDKQRKDALLLSGLQGLTQDEQEQEMMTGSTNKQDRVTRRRISGEWRGAYAGMAGFENIKDKPFEQLSLSAGLSRAPAIRYKDLEAIVATRVTYSQLPFHVRQDYIRLTEQQALVPVTLVVANDKMTFKPDHGVLRARVHVFGRVSRIDNRVETIFEDDIEREYAAEQWEKAKTSSSIYQKQLILKPGLYKLEVVVQDVESRRIGTLEQRLEVPRSEEGALKLSSLILAERIESDAPGGSSSSFKLGDLKVVPRTEEMLRSADSLGFYLQVYNFGVDPKDQRPQLKAEYGLARRGAEPENWRDVTSLVKFAGPHCRIARMVSLSRLQPGEYEMRVRIRDKISGQSASALAPFRVVP
ncbi:MAG TPA: GWxTD domain-containing protein [Acidobacteriota bacterium]